MLVLTHNTWCTGSAYPVTNRRRCALLVAEVLAATAGHLRAGLAAADELVVYPGYVEVEEVEGVEDDDKEMQ